MGRGKLIAVALALIFIGVAPGPVLAQGGAEGTIRLIVPFAPAGSGDVLARLLQAPLQEELKQTIIVENHAGAGSNIGTVQVARAKPDGLTLLLSTSAFVVNPGLYKNIPYDFAGIWHRSACFRWRRTSSQSIRSRAASTRFRN